MTKPKPFVSRRWRQSVKRSIVSPGISWNTGVTKALKDNSKKQSLARLKPASIKNPLNTRRWTAGWATPSINHAGSARDGAGSGDFEILPHARYPSEGFSNRLVACADRDDGCGRSDVPVGVRRDGRPRLLSTGDQVDGLRPDPARPNAQPMPKKKSLQQKPYPSCNEWSRFAQNTTTRKAHHVQKPARFFIENSSNPA
jgi:hypothetical protein